MSARACVCSSLALHAEEEQKSLLRREQTMVKSLALWYSFGDFWDRPHEHEIEASVTKGNNINKPFSRKHCNK